VADWPDRFEDPPGPGASPENAEMPQPGFEQPAEPSRVDALIRQHGPQLLALDGIEGIAAGRTPAGGDAIVVFLRDEQARASLPQEIEGVPLQPVVTGPIDAQ
jgi:hypothetical protein